MLIITVIIIRSFFYHFSCCCCRRLKWIDWKLDRCCVRLMTFAVKQHCEILHSNVIVCLQRTEMIEIAELATNNIETGSQKKQNTKSDGDAIYKSSCLLVYQGHCSFLMLHGWHICSFKPFSYWDCCPYYFFPVSFCFGSASCLTFDTWKLSGGG